MQLIKNRDVRTVSEINAEIKFLLEGKYRFVSVSGEISNLRIPYSGHQYFTLKDSKAQIRAVLFKGSAKFLDTALADGQHVICRGRISVYEPRGEYQIIVDSVDQHGEGALQLKFEQLKKRLNDEGLFDSQIKKVIPPYPEHVVVVSSPTGAAVQDFLKICAMRKTMTRVQVYPVSVQGDRAAGEISAAIKRINKDVGCDAIVLCRGGGSLEDLWAFNEEAVARAIYESKIPVITGIGHEIDHTIADFCADLRAPTPTGAAEILMPDSIRLRSELQKTVQALYTSVAYMLDMSGNSLNQQKRLLRSFSTKIDTGYYRLDNSVERLRSAVLNSLSAGGQRLSRLSVRLENQAPLTRIRMREQELAHRRDRLMRYMEEICKKKEYDLAKCAALLNSVSPLSTLARGYAIVETVDRAGAGSVITSSSQVRVGDPVGIRLSEGRLACRVEETLAADEKEYLPTRQAPLKKHSYRSSRPEKK